MKKLLILSLLIIMACFCSEPSWGQSSSQYYEGPDSEVMFHTSLDVAKKLLTGPSYQDFANSGNVFGFNVGMFYNPWGAKRKLQREYDLPTTLVSPHLSTLLASTANLPGPTAPDPASKTSFLSHVYPLIGIQLIGKGGKDKDDFGGTSVTRMTYLEIPMYAMYGYKLPDNKGGVFGGMGPYIAYGLWGKETFKGQGFDESFKAFDTDNGGYKRFDAGLNFMVGYQLPQGLSLSLVREIGLVNIDSGNSADKTFNRVWSLNVGYPLEKIVSKLKKK